MQVVTKRRANPTNKNDLVDAMLNEVDPLTGKGLTDGTIIDNMITFLIAGTFLPLGFGAESATRHAKLPAIGHENYY